MRKILLAAACALALASLGHAQDGAGAAPPPGRSIYNLDETWTDQDGATKPLASLRGAPAVVAMGYTICKDLCPAVVLDMTWIEKHLKPESAKKVRFAFFSFDSAADTPERLKFYAEAHGLDLDRWTLLESDDDSVRDLAAALGVRYRPDGQGGFIHSAVITLLDKDGVIVFQQQGVEATPKELLDRVERLLASGS